MALGFHFFIFSKVCNLVFMGYSFSKKVSICLILKEALKEVKSKPFTFLFIFMSAKRQKSRD